MLLTSTMILPVEAHCANKCDICYQSDQTHHSKISTALDYFRASYS